MTNTAQIAAAAAAAEMIDVDILALVAKADQIAEMNVAADGFTAFWAGSISASVGHHYARKAYRKVRG